MIERVPFGSTGYRSTRVIFGAAALAGMTQARADEVLEVLLEFGINHLDTAAMYGDSEKRLAPWLKAGREQFFVASKTLERSASGAYESIQRSLRRLEVDSLDLIQLHNLTDEQGWQEAMSAGGAVEGCRRARDEGLVRYIGVTGHGTWAPSMHRRSLDAFAFDSVLAPYNFMMMQNETYRDDFDRLAARCREDGVALQTIKSIARRRWPTDDASRKFSWYEPLRDEGAIRRAVSYVLSERDLFLNSSSDATLLRATLEAATQFDGSEAFANLESALHADQEGLGLEALFVRGVSDSI
jgi:aryl-alcohol dehydrogenase-like predicted oxidoreductase